MKYFLAKKCNSPETIIFNIKGQGGGSMLIKVTEIDGCM